MRTRPSQTCELVPKWPRPQYFQTPPHDFVVAALRQDPCAQYLTDLLDEDPLDVDAICMEAQRMRHIHPWLRSTLVALGQTPDTIKQSWLVNRTTAAHAGTYTHYLLECYLNRAVVPVRGNPEFELFLQLLPQMVSMSAFRTEWTIYADQERLAGSIDFVAQNREGDLVLVDWKRSKQLRTKYRAFGNRGMLQFLSHIPDAQGHHYRLQLNLYKYIIEHYYGYRVAEMWVVCLHPDNGHAAFVDRVPLLQSEVASMMAHQRMRVRENEAMQVEDSLEWTRHVSRIVGSSALTTLVSWSITTWVTTGPHAAPLWCGRRLCVMGTHENLAHFSHFSTNI